MSATTTPWFGDNSGSDNNSSSSSDRRDKGEEAISVWKTISGNVQNVQRDQYAGSCAIGQRQADDQDD